MQCRNNRACRHLFLTWPAFAVACGGGQSVYPTTDGGTGGVTGAVFKGPVRGARVTAYRLDGQFNRGPALAFAISDERGAFAISLPPYNGHLQLVATGGSYIEEAVGNSVRLDGTELAAVLLSYRFGEVRNGLISPVSHWASALAEFYVRSEGRPINLALEEAWQHLNRHFGRVDWRTVAPTDVNGADGGVQMGDADREGVLLSALSQLALSIARRAAVTPGVGFTTVELATALALDIGADGLFDGKGPGRREILLPSGVLLAPRDAGVSATPLDGETVRSGLGRALKDFVDSPRNRSGLALSDVQPLIDQLTANPDSRIFPRPGSVH